jgi:hypothetical protein
VKLKVVGRGATGEIDLTRGMWRLWGKLIFGPSFRGASEAEIDVGPTPMAGKTREWTSAADHVERYAHTSSVMMSDLFTCFISSSMIPSKVTPTISPALSRLSME